jgi:biopolymer transport protein TolR
VSTRSRGIGRGRRARSAGEGRLNLVSLMDIFTILVFFLLVNSSDSQEVPSSKILAMPESVADQKPRETVTVMVTADRILVQGREVATVADAASIAGTTIETLRAALDAEHERMIVEEGGSDGDGQVQREVTIMGDKSTPFRVLKKVMATCTEADYTRVSLAVVQRGPEAAAVQGAG